MTQQSSPDQEISTLMQSIDPEQIADKGVRQTVEVLLNLIEKLNAKIKDLVAENQKLRDENNRLKGEEGKPNIKSNKTEGFQKDHSSEKERKIPKEHKKRSKNVSI